MPAMYIGDESRERCCCMAASCVVVPARKRTYLSEGTFTQCLPDLVLSDTLDLHKR